MAESKRRHRPAATPEARENQLITLAVDLAEKQLREGTATSQVVVHYLKAASTRERLERERLENENELLRARTKDLEAAHSTQALFEEAVEAMKSYKGYDGESSNV